MAHDSLEVPRANRNSDNDLCKLRNLTWLLPPAWVPTFLPPKAEMYWKVSMDQFGSLLTLPHPALGPGGLISNECTLWPSSDIYFSHCLNLVLKPESADVLQTLIGYMMVGQ